MAEHKVRGDNKMLLWIDPAGGTHYDMVVCLLRVSKEDTVADTDAASACGPDSSPGALTLNYTFEGQHLQDPATGKISGTSLRQLLRNKTTVGWLIAPQTPVSGDEIESGTGFFTSLNSEYAFDTVGTFTGSFKAYGTPTLTEQS